MDEGNEEALNERMRALSRTLSAVLRQNLLGQDEPIGEVCALLQRAFVARAPDRPVASMLLAGPTGVGKTEAARVLTRHLYGSEGFLARVDCSELGQPGGTGILIGDRPGERGLLGPLHDRTGGCGVFLFDEVEKAYPLVLDLFLQLLSAARVTLSSGETLDFRRSIFIATSNLGGRALVESRTLEREYLVRRTLQAVRDCMRPELYARFEGRFVFNRIPFEVQAQIAGLHLARTVEMLNRQGHALKATPSAAAYVRRAGYTEEYGARPLEQAALHAVGGAVHEALVLNGGRYAQGTLRYDRSKGRLTLFPS